MAVVREGLVSTGDRARGATVLKYHYADGSEDVIGQGEACVAKPGHTPELYPDTEVVEFIPTAELAKTLDVVTANMEKANRAQ